ncbi:TPA: recombination regulator RecX [Streptococcus suis]|nr:recombination regulator RecX [Streptococcus suis]
MKITKIEKKKRLYLLELDQTETLSITEDTIVRFMLSKDKEISPQELTEIKNFAQLSYGKNLALYHISFKRRARKEVQDYLTKHEIDPTIIPTILDQLEAEKWIDDQAYIQQILYQNANSGDKGPLVLRQKLAQKGLSKSLIEQEFAMEDFEEIAERLAKKLLKKYQEKLPQRALKDKLAQSLIAKGFEYGLAKQAITNLAIEADSEREEELIYQELDKQHRKYSKKYEGYELKQRLLQALARKGYDYDQSKSALRHYLE